MFIGLIGAVAVGCHSYMAPKSHAYLYSLAEMDSEVFLYLSGMPFRDEIHKNFIKTMLLCTLCVVL